PHAAGGEDGKAGCSNLPEELEVGPRERAVAFDRGGEDAGDACVPAPLGGGVDAEARALRPAGGANLSVADVERDDEPIAEVGPRRRVREGCRPDDDAVCSCRE